MDQVASSRHVGATSAMATVIGLRELNEAPREAALRLLEPVVERSAWVAERTIDQRPFASDQDVAQRLVDTILESRFEDRVTLFRAHPELAGREAAAGTMTDASTSEQGRLGLTSLGPTEARRLAQMNAAYADRFGHPFIIALHRVPDLEALFSIFARRLAASAVEEHVSALAEIASVISARAAIAFGPAAPGTPEDQSVVAADG